MFIQKVLLAITSNKLGNKTERNRKIFIQQDNARPHVLRDDPEILQISTSDEIDFLLIY